MTSINYILHEYLYPFMIIYFSLFLGMRSATVNSCRENQNKCLMSHTIFRKYCRLWDNVVKLFGSGKVTNGNMVKVHFKLETEFYSHSEYVWEHWLSCHYELDYEERLYLTVDTVITAEYFVCLLYLKQK